jgi:hypothetical protein
MVRYLFYPSTLILLAANLVPLVGVLSWGWDAFVLLVLYWLETAVIAFWTIVRIAITPRDALGDIKFQGSDKPGAPLGLALFFTLHAGIFMAVHFLFLWELFSGGWSRKIHGPREFIDQIVIGTGLWIPLLVLFVVRGGLMLFESFQPHLRRMFQIAPSRRPQTAVAVTPAEASLFGLYARIFIMQLTILAGAWVALLVGAAGAYALLVLLKTGIDVAFQVAGDRIYEAMKNRAKDASPST